MKRIFCIITCIISIIIIIGLLFTLNCFAGATITKGYTFGSTDEVTNVRLNNLVDNATFTRMTDADGDTKVDTEESADEDKIRIDTGGSERLVIDSRGMENSLKFINTVDADVIADSGDGNPATADLEPTASFVTITCNDSDTCDMTLTETNAVDGTFVTIVNISSNTVDFSDTSGVSELAGSFAAGQYDSISLLYVTDRWVEISRSNN